MKKTILSMIALGACTISSIALAANLTIINNSSEPSTSRINDSSFCSNEVLGPMGITPAHQTRVLNENILKIACKGNLTNCKADVYMTANCTGEKLATLNFNVNTGFPAPFTIKSGKYTLSGSGFTVSLVEG